MPNLVRRVAHLPLCAFTVLAACSGERWAEYASNADESADAASIEAALFVVSAESAEGMITPEAQASAAAEDAGSWFTPEGCVTATASGPTTTYVLDRCTGPFGYAVFTGIVIVTYQARATGISFTASATDLSVNEATVTFESSGVFTNAGTPTLVVTSSAEGRGARGTRLLRDGEYTLTWTEARDCIGLDGTWDTTVGAVRWSTVVSGYDRCANACPAAGGSIAWSSASGDVEVTYDGSSTAAYSVMGRRDRDGTVELLCGE